jgi:hypothetical protein
MDPVVLAARDIPLIQPTTLSQRWALLAQAAAETFARPRKYGLLGEKRGLLEKRPSTVEGAGFGLFATEDIPPGTPLGWYCGPSHPFDEKDDDVYTVNASDQETADKVGHWVTRSGPWCAAACSNDAGPSNPNKVNAHFSYLPAGYSIKENEVLTVQTIEGRMNMLFAGGSEHDKRVIRAGSEIFLDYGESYWKDPYTPPAPTVVEEGPIEFVSLPTPSMEHTDAKAPLRLPSALEAVPRNPDIISAALVLAYVCAEYLFPKHRPEPTSAENILQYVKQNPPDETTLMKMRYGETRDERRARFTKNLSESERKKLYPAQRIIPFNDSVCFRLASPAIYYIPQTFRRSWEGELEPSMIHLRALFRTSSEMLGIESWDKMIDTFYGFVKSYVVPRRQLEPTEESKEGLPYVVAKTHLQVLDGQTTDQLLAQRQVTNLIIYSADQDGWFNCSEIPSIIVNMSIYKNPEGGYEYSCRDEIPKELTVFSIAQIQWLLLCMHQVVWGHRLTWDLRPERLHELFGWSQTAKFLGIADVIHFHLFEGLVQWTLDIRPEEFMPAIKTKMLFPAPLSQSIDDHVRTNILRYLQDIDRWTGKTHLAETLQSNPTLWGRRVFLDLAALLGHIDPTQRIVGKLESYAANCERDSILLSTPDFGRWDSYGSFLNLSPNDPFKKNTLKHQKIVTNTLESLVSVRFPGSAWLLDQLSIQSLQLRILEFSRNGESPLHLWAAQKNNPVLDIFRANKTMSLRFENNDDMAVINSVRDETHLIITEIRGASTYLKEALLFVALAYHLVNANEEVVVVVHSEYLPMIQKLGFIRCSDRAFAVIGRVLFKRMREIDWLLQLKPNPFFCDPGEVRAQSMRAYDMITATEATLRLRGLEKLFHITAAAGDLNHETLPETLADFEPENLLSLVDIYAEMSVLGLDIGSDKEVDNLLIYILQAAILDKKEDTPENINRLLSQIRNAMV